MFLFVWIRYVKTFIQYGHKIPSIKTSFSFPGSHMYCLSNLELGLWLKTAKYRINKKGTRVQGYGNAVQEIVRHNLTSWFFFYVTMRPPPHTTPPDLCHLAISRSVYDISKRELFWFVATVAVSHATSFLFWWWLLRPASLFEHIPETIWPLKSSNIVGSHISGSQYQSNHKATLLWPSIVCIRNKTHIIL